MDHSYGVMQDSGISSPSQPEMGRAWGKHVLVVQEAGGHMFVKEEPQEISRGTYSSMPHLLDYTEEVETSGDCTNISTHSFCKSTTMVVETHLTKM